MPSSYLLKIHFNIILLSKLGCSKWPLSQRVSHQNPVFCAALRWKFAFDGTWRLYRVETVAMLAQKSRFNCKNESSFACRPIWAYHIHNTIDGARNGQHGVCWILLQSEDGDRYCRWNVVFRLLSCSALFLLILIKTRYDGQSPSRR